MNISLFCEATVTRKTVYNIVTRSDVVVQRFVRRALAQGDHPQLGVERLLGLDDGPPLDANDAGHFETRVVNVHAQGVVDQRRHLEKDLNQNAF